MRSTLLTAAFAVAVSAATLPLIFIFLSGLRSSSLFGHLLIITLRLSGSFFMTSQSILEEMQCTVIYMTDHCPSTFGNMAYENTFGS